MEEGERTQQRKLVASSCEIHQCRITFKLLHFHFPREICGTFRWFTAASFHPSVFGARSSPLSMWRKGKPINAGWMMRKLILRVCSPQRQWMNWAAKIFAFKKQRQVWTVDYLQSQKCFYCWDSGREPPHYIRLWGGGHIKVFFLSLKISPLSSRVKTPIKTARHTHRPVHEQQSWRGSTGLIPHPYQNFLCLAAFPCPHAYLQSDRYFETPLAARLIIIYCLFW